MNLETSRLRGRFPSLTGTYGEDFRLEDDEDRVGADGADGAVVKAEVEEWESDTGAEMGRATKDSVLGLKEGSG